MSLYFSESYITINQLFADRIKTIEQPAWQFHDTEYAEYTERIIEETNCKLAEREHFISNPLKELLKGWSQEEKPDILVDCSSSTTYGGPAQVYKLAKLIQIPRCMPVTFTGSGGTEFVQGLEHVRNMKNKIGNGIAFSISQTILTPQSRRNGNDYLLGDAAVSLMVTPTFHKNKSKIELLDLNTIQLTKYSDINKVKKYINLSIEKLGISKEDIKWSVPHNYNNSIADIVADLLPFAKIITRAEFSYINFGCADPFITLKYCKEERKDIGIVWSMGRFHTISYMIVSVL